MNLKSLNQKVDKHYSILLVESDKMVSALLKTSLERQGYTVYQEFSVDQITNNIVKLKPNMVLFEIDSSNINNKEICFNIREVFHGPLVILSGNDDEKLQLSAYSAGADDYIIKPISFNLLEAKLEAIIRRVAKNTQYEANQKVEVGDLSLYPQAQKCKVKGKGIRLSGFEFQLLLLLLSNVGKVLTRDEIYSLLLGREYNGLERTIDVRISTLRDKLAKQGMEQTQIETVWGKGYILNTSAA